MPTTEIPKQDPASPPLASHPGGDLYDAEEWKSAYLDENDVPALLIQLQDDLSRSRQREAFWMSVVVHLTIIILFVNSQRLERLFFRPVIVVQQPSQIMRDKDTTFLQLPPDEQKLTKPPETDKLSDKNSIATSKSPQLDRQELKKILDAARPGRPGPQTPPAQPPQPQQPPAAAMNQPPQQSQPQQAEPQQAQQTPPAANQNQSAKLETPPVTRKPPSFSTGPVTAGSAIEQAARAALATRGNGYPGDNGDYGLNQGRQPAKSMGPVDILSDTMGVDFGPYLSRILHDIRENWIRAIPPSAEFKKGKVTLQFAILKDGRVTGIQLFESSGDPPLDRAAWAGITGSDPLPALPPDFGGTYFGLRLRFCLNMEECPAR